MLNLTETNSLFKRKEYQKVVDSCKKILEKHPSETSVLNLISASYLALSNFKMAREYALRLLETGENVASAYNYLGVSYINEDKLKANEYFKKAILADSNLKNPLISIDGLKEAKALYDKGEYSSAIEILNRLLAQFPNNVSALNTISSSYLSLKEHKLAEEFTTKALKIDKNSALAHSNLGSIYIEKDYIKAEEYFKKAIELDSTYLNPYMMLGYINYKIRKDYQEAKSILLRGKKIDPLSKNLDTHLSMLYLFLGEYEKGFDLYRARYSDAITNRSRVKIENGSTLLRKGDQLKDKSLLVASEQGLGDFIQFLRFLPQIDEKNPKKISLTVPDTLKKIVKINYPNISILSLYSSKIFDYQTPIGDLPYHLNSRAETIPFPEGYLRVAPDDSKAFFNNNFLDSKKIDIGIAYKSNSNAIDAKTKSIPIKDFLRAIKEFTQIFNFYSLQYNPSREEMDMLKRGGITTFNSIDDFYDTALAIDNLDYIITIDTSVAHVSGAMGKKTVVLIPYTYDWRWSENRESLVWYKSIKTIKQHRLHCWGGALCEVRELLKQISLSPTP